MADEANPINTYGSAGHFANQAAFEVQRTNHFEVVIHLDELEKLGIDSKGIEHIRMSTKSFTQPKVSAEQLELRHGNDIVKVAKSPTWDDLTLTVYDTIGVDQVNLLQQWFNMIFNPKTKLMGLAKDYKCTATLYMYSPDGDSMKRQWNLQGVWPKSFGQGNEFSFDGTGDGQTVSLELSVDRYWEQTIDDDKSTNGKTKTEMMRE